MATPYKIHLTVEDTGIVKNKEPTAESAAKASELLQVNHDNFHIIFNEHGFHNHLAHQLLTLYGIGAPTSILEAAYETNKGYQTPSAKLEEAIVEDMAHPGNFKKYLGRKKYHRDFLVFFQKEMEAKGWENVLNEYVFAGDERADDMLVRMFAGLIHPLIHLGFGIEFNQPAIIAEALAQAAIHDNSIGDLLLPTEKAGKQNGKIEVSLFDLLEQIQNDPSLKDAARWEDGNKILDGVMTRARQEMIECASTWTATPETLERKTAEMINAAVYFTAGAQRPPKQVKFDFFYMHSVNSSIFFPVFNAQPWLSTENKIRLLQWKGYFDLTLYASRGAPAPLLEDIVGYTPKDMEAGGGEWPGVLNRLMAFQDDGHAIKLGRAVKNADNYTSKYENEPGFKIKGFMWEKIANMIIDSVEDTGDTWVRNAGFKEAWEDFEDKPRKTAL
ncbi:HypA protein [Phlyctema vagabunda]|uniref:HypA protein n=1 Tax=Phlyctema vagabunda TaxID=108571 RepID=A0ABR4PID0_9HELO